MPFGKDGHLSDPIFHAPAAMHWHNAAELCTVSLCGSALTDTTDNLSEMCLTKFTLLPVFVPSIVECSIAFPYLKLKIFHISVGF